MSNNHVVTIDSHEIDKLLETLNDDEYKRKILYDAVKAGAKVLQQNTKKLFRQRMGASASHVSKWLRKPFVEGITMKGYKDYVEASVIILKDFRMKFFEMGTKERTTKGRKILGYAENGRNLKREGKGHSTGRIKPLYFFRDARQDTAPINEAMTKSLDNALKKLDK